MTLKYRRGPWSSTEDVILLQLVSLRGAHNWVQISQMIQSRSAKQCRERYHQNLKPSLKIEPMSIEEGLLIEKLVAEMGKRWVEIARRLGGRSDNAVKNWWNESMKRMDNRRWGSASSFRIQPSPKTTQRYNTQFTFHSVEPQHQNRSPRKYHAAARRPRESVPRVNQPSLRTIDAPLPSPSSFSSSSIAESTHGNSPPSLVTDTDSQHCSPHQSSSPKTIEMTCLPPGPPSSHLHFTIRGPSLPVYHLDTGSSMQHAEKAVLAQLSLHTTPPPATYRSYLRAETRLTQQWNTGVQHSPTDCLRQHRSSAYTSALHPPEHPSNSYNSPPPPGQNPPPQLLYRHSARGTRRCNSQINVYCITCLFRQGCQDESRQSAVIKE